MAKRFTIKEILTKARNLIKRYGWCRGDLQNPDGRMCVRGAMNKAICGDPMEWIVDDSHPVEIKVQ